MEDAFLGRLGLFESVMFCSKIVERVHEPMEEWVEPNGKEHKFRGVLSSCTGLQEPIQRIKQYTTANQ